MHYKFIKLQDFVSNYNPLYPTQETLEGFKQSLEVYFKDIVKAVENKESEEHQKNILRDFLKQTFAYECNTKGRIDLAIYEYSTPKVIFETKPLAHKKMNLLGGGGKTTLDTNTLEDTPNIIRLESKALYESILYYLRESLTHKNNNLSFILLSNTRDFYFIDTKEFVQFTKHKDIIKAFKNCEHKEGNDTSTQKFYDELKLLLPSLDSTLAFTHFALTQSLLAENLHTSLLPLIYQALSPAVLLKRKSYIDASTLNVGFYNELLYILGLEEQRQNGKVLIKANAAKIRS
ncbi:hypothetical protein OQH61_04560 [Helicobacter sp. MIT 21-1697]|uniref:DUF7149 domain-containing protein n=1 Tax=Helicobacter sp. MIT 21-1697 TaxID=2993733 RepID=UPI00224AE225|nr:hypothetical protein [Helicobacter sp. MIT 21-1697]MCX2717005.1 hypothetical protein [Helicobacter sp. MIT 21-1697]